MSENVVVKLSTAGEQPSEAAKLAHRELDRFEQMVEVTSWTNRLDDRLNTCLEEIKLWFKKTIDETEQTGELPEVEDIRESAKEIFEKTFPELIELCVVAADHVYLLDRYAAELRERLIELQPTKVDTKYSYLARVWRVLGRELRVVRNTIAPKDDKLPSKEKSQSRQAIDKNLLIDYVALESYDVDPLVDNSNTALSLYDNWATQYHYQGKTYGSASPKVSDHFERIIDLHKVIDFRGKNVLEIGPFEAGNTKQMLDLGASSVVAVEANPEMYKKCLIVKEAFKLNAAEFIYGDCNEVLNDEQFSKRFPFDICFASGMLYHMNDPLETIKLLSRTAPLLYIFSHIASEQAPTGDWYELNDGATTYRARKNFYKQNDKWGGTDNFAVWLSEDSMKNAFSNQGFNIHNCRTLEHPHGTLIEFIAKRQTNSTDQE